MSKYQSTAGTRFGRLIVISDYGTCQKRRLLCQCDCGTQVDALRNNVVRGITSSCGCLARESARKSGQAAQRHGHTRQQQPSREYRTWVAMKSRCQNPKAPNFEYYGGAGISICERWQEFAAFLADMGTRPIGTSLDRIDSTKGYYKDNCRWATAKEQSRNRAIVHIITINGDSQCLTEWANRAGISDTAMLYRVRQGMTGEDLLRPSHHGKRLQAATARLARCVVDLGAVQRQGLLALPKPKQLTLSRDTDLP